MDAEASSAAALVFATFASDGIGDTVGVSVTPWSELKTEGESGVTGARPAGLSVPYVAAILPPIPVRATTQIAPIHTRFLPLLRTA